MKETKKAIKTISILTGFFLLLSCNPVVKESQSDSLLVVLNLTGTDIEGNEVNFLQSDVVQVDPDTGYPYVTADPAKATFTAKLMDPASALGPSHYNSITVNRYTVTYTRSDGKKREGVDVPYSFEGSLSILVEIEETVDASFIIVREVAKLEPPLVNLREGRGEGVIEMQAKVDFYGQDMAENKVKATGYLTIFFANYIDE
ncbi:MAG: hypothetical protein ACLFVG_06315 [Candidatus Aminicenantes bacterium]